MILSATVMVMPTSYSTTSLDCTNAVHFAATNSLLQPLVQAIQNSCKSTVLQVFSESSSHPALQGSLKPFLAAIFYKLQLIFASIKPLFKVVLQNDYLPLLSDQVAGFEKKQLKLIIPGCIRQPMSLLWIVTRSKRLFHSENSLNA